MPKAAPLHVVVRHFDDELGTQRLPRQILALTPPAADAGPSLWRSLIRLFPIRPLAPRITLERVLAIRRKKGHELVSLRGREARADAHVLEPSFVVVQAEQQRTDRRALPPFVPAESGDDAIA